MRRVAIIGAGIGGLTTAIALQKFRPGLTIDIYERSAALKAAGAGLSLAANAIKAFEQLGIHEKVIGQSRVLEQFAILDRRGKRITGTNHLLMDEQFNTISNFSVHRADLQKVLLDCLGGTPLHLGKKLESFVQSDSGVDLYFEDGTQAWADFVIATDGIHSVFRQQLAPHSGIRFAGYTCWRGITNKLPPHFNPTLATETWGCGKRFGIVPLPGGRVYWFACINAAKRNDPSFAAYQKKQLLADFHCFHQPVAGLISLTNQEDIIWNDIIDFAPLKKFAYGNILLLGDAAHATTPNMGQGACQAIEGAVILGKALQQIPDLQEAFEVFEQKRLRRTAFIVNRSWQIGKLAQLANPVLSWIRNGLFRLVPAKANGRQIAKILEVGF